MSIKMIKQFFISVVVASGLVFSAQVQAHGGLALADDLCILTVGPYTIHFTGYQPLTQEEEFCEDIPEIGKTVVALDYVNDELRPMETEVRIVTGSRILVPDDVKKISAEDLTSMTVYHLPAQVYPSASIMIDHTFSEKGKFAGIVTVSGEGKEWISVFPFSVGEGRRINWMTQILPYVVLVAAAAFFFLRSRKKSGQDGKPA
ncbi:MAG: hypothetical protein IT525_13750 [Nitrosomonas sp.]|jgi:hypothetical protein|nr:hypothetical protein [Nitrosomonas sp.]